MLEFDLLTVVLILLGMLGLAALVWVLWPKFFGSGRYPAGGYPSHGDLARVYPDEPWRSDLRATGFGREAPTLEHFRERLRDLDGRVADLEQKVRTLESQARHPEVGGAAFRGGASLPEHDVRGTRLVAADHASETPAAPVTSASAAGEYYRRLSEEGLKGLAANTIFATLDMDTGAQGGGIGESQRRFVESDSRQSPFVIFRNGAAEGEGWLFPNPRIAYTEAMKYVFPALNHENFDHLKADVDPRDVSAPAPGVWELYRPAES